MVGKRLGRLAGVLLLAVSAAAVAQDSGWRSFASITPLYEEGDLDSGGDQRTTGVLTRFGTTRDLGGGTRIGISGNYDYFDYSFGNPVAFGGVAPWGIVQRYGVSVPVSFAVGDGWSIGVTPSADWFKENGATSSDALAWGATLTAVKRFEGGNLLGLGVAAYDSIEDTSVFPFFVVDWRFNERWRLVNPLPAGPTGPAGIELDYLFDNGWSMGVGAAWRRMRFRLSENGPVPNGVGEESGVPVFLRASREFGPSLALHFYGGVIVGGEMRVEDPSGNRLRKDDMDTAVLVGINITARF